MRERQSHFQNNGGQHSANDNHVSILDRYSQQLEGMVRGALMIYDLRSNPNDKSAEEDSRLAFRRLGEDDIR